MENNIEKALGLISSIENKEELTNLFSSLLSKTSEDKKELNSKESEKAMLIQEKIDLLTRFASIFDGQKSEKIQIIIKLLTIAKLIEEIRQIKS